MRNARRSSGSGRRLLLPALCLLLVALAAGRAVAQEVEDITGALEKYRGILAVANQKLEDLELPEALARFTEVIDGYLSGQLPSSTPLTRQIVGQAYEGRARTYANLGREAEAAADFEALIRFDPTWPIDRETTSPKIVALYDKVRKRVVGVFALKTEPPGALVSLNGESIGRSPVFDRELPSGTYKLEVTAEGYDPTTESFTLEGGDRVDRAIRLVPNARDILVATSPAGATVLVDDEPRGSTFGTAGPEYATVAQQLGVELTDISAPLLVGHLSPGGHHLKVTKECFAPQVLSIDISVDPNDNQPVRFEPIRLNRSLGSLTIDSVPTGAEVSVDGQRAGIAPVRLDSLCSGPHHVVMRSAGLGQWIGEVNVPRGEKVDLKQGLRLTLAYAGMTEPGPAGQAPEGEEAIGRALGSLETWNVVGPDSGLPENLLARNNTGAGSRAAWLASVRKATGADLVVSASPSEGAFERKADLIFNLPDYPGVTDTLTLSLSGDEPFGDLVARLDRPETLSRPWLGLHIIELLRSTNPVAIRVEPGSPAAEAGAVVGEGVVSLGGRAIRNPSDLAEALAGLREGARASLTLQAPGQQPRQVNVTIGSTPVIAPPEVPGRLDTVTAARLAFKARMEAATGHPGSAGRTAALLGLASILMQHREYEAALTDALSKASLPPGPGISGGTVSYMRAQCLKALGRPAEARRELETAAGQSDSTLWTNDGPPVADRARRALQAL